MFYKHSNEGKVANLTIHANDIIVIGDYGVERLNKISANAFEIKDLDALKYFLYFYFLRKVCPW